MAHSDFQVCLQVWHGGASMKGLALAIQQFSTPFGPQQDNFIV
jgi:hypothetical protein